MLVLTSGAETTFKKFLHCYHIRLGILILQCFLFNSFCYDYFVLFQFTTYLSYQNFFAFYHFILIYVLIITVACIQVHDVS